MSSSDLNQLQTYLALTVSALLPIYLGSYASIQVSSSTSPCGTLYGAHSTPPDNPALLSDTQDGQTCDT